jgi:hypothetical protein
MNQATTTRHLPGFTAEASLFRSNGSYCTVGAPGPIGVGWHVLGPIGVPLSAFGTTLSNWSTELHLAQNFGAGFPWPMDVKWLKATFWTFTLCNGMWVDTLTDKHNCGACGIDCGDDGTGNIIDNELCFCNYGGCACWERCPIEFPTLCGYQCADPQNQLTCKVLRCRDLWADVNNCGICGNQCNAGEVCCAGSCSNLLTDPNNCGSCGNACTVAHGWGVCWGGICKIGGCNSPWADCNGIYADGCETDLSSNNNNCGACGHACGPTQLCCHSACMNLQNLQTDPANCGSCGHACNPGEVCCAGSCANLLSDSKNCGACGKLCTGGQVCINGGCVCPMPLSYCNNICVNTNTDRNNCGGCDRICPPSQACCSGSCKDLTNDQLNCGSCGNVCPEGCSGVRASCYGGGCGHLNQIACYFEDPVYKCPAGAQVYSAFTAAEAMMCAQRDHIGALVQCGFPPQQFNYDVYQNVGTDICPSGNQCFSYYSTTAFNQNDALSCVQSRYGQGYTPVLNPSNPPCNMGDCKS